ncbi:MAG TPA: cation diffusion facilitator family transporter [Spirochaetota bacterium]|nr:cation diffusion facilitator family transporter [Spirochaetota bacterium]HOM38802.1 cation diffusion facilitator family transporter [Spirochaetota bacterium]HPQ49860.1 cation diffusion facilitator family transporter [Spirochaetota bacterium]
MIEKYKRYAYIEGIVSIIFNTILGGGKIVFGFLSNSISVIADGFHSLSDTISSVAVIFSVKVALKPPDREHPFGHGRSTNIGNFIIAVMLIFIGFEFIKTSVSTLFDQKKVDVNSYLIGITIFSIVSKELLARYSLYLYKKSTIELLKTDAYHHRSDSLSSLVVLIGIIGSYYGIYILDSVIGAIVGLIIIKDGTKIVRKEITDLLGRKPSKEEVDNIVSIATSVEGVKGVHSIIINNYELTKIVSLHIEVDSKMTFEDAHKISDLVEDRIRDKGYFPTIHIDPVDDKDKLIEEVKKIISDRIEEKYKGIIKSFHSIKIKKDLSKKNNVSFTISFTDRIAKNIEEDIKKELKDLLTSKINCNYINIEIEPLFFY